MSFGIPVRNGLAIGLTPSSTLSSGRGRGRLPTDGTPTLILNFVGYTDPVTFEPGNTLVLDFLGVPDTTDQRALELDFTTESYELGVPYVADPNYEVYQPDPSQPQSGITSYYVWS
jgi:hypothetical protein